MNKLDRKYSFAFEIENLKILITLFSDFFNEQSVHTQAHSHGSFEFQLISKGNTQISTSHNTIHLLQSQACIIPPNVIHTCISDVQKPIKSSFNFSFEKINKKTTNDVYGTFSKVFSEMSDIKKIDNADEYLHKIKQIMQICSEKTRFATMRIKHYFSLIMLELADTLISDAEHSKNTYEVATDMEFAEKTFRRMILEDYINRNFNTNITLDSLSKSLHLSKKQTERFFAKEMHTTFKTFVNKIRIESAIYYLKNTDLSMSEIALKIGYDSYNGFYRLFITRFGMSPQEYRLEYKKAADNICC